MSATTMQLRNTHPNAKTDTNASPRSPRERKRTLELGTFADGQRASHVTVTYSAPVGSFAESARK